jgi:hypothetical protein
MASCSTPDVPGGSGDADYVAYGAGVGLGGMGATGTAVNAGNGLAIISW